MLKRLAKRAGALYSQFSPVRASRLLLADVGAKVLGRFGEVSYSEAGEDRLLDFVLPSNPNGFFVDVGCNEPIAYSNTFRLYKRGWSGLAVDANPEMVRQYLKVRPRDQAVVAAVGRTGEAVTFHIARDPLMSSSDEAFVIGKLGRENVKETVSLVKVSLQEILDRAAAPKRFELLCVDAEGSDLEVLQSLDFGDYRAAFIMVESLDFDAESALADPVVGYLTGVGYALRYVCGRNLLLEDRQR